MRTYSYTSLKAIGLRLIVVFALTLLVSTAAVAGDQDFTLHNDTGVTIHRLYVSPHKADERGDDILGRDTLDDGESVDITFSRHETAAHWDLRVEDKEGNAITWESLNLLEISEITLHYKDGKAWADLK